MKFILKYTLALLTLLTIVSCESDFLNVNESPNDPKVAELPKLLTETQYRLGIATGVGSGTSYLAKPLSGVTHGLSIREIGTYALTPGENGTSNAWSSINVTIIPNLEAIIETATLEENTHFAGIAKIMRAYLYSIMVDLWGDIPYSEANTPEINTPKLDDQKEIYNDLLAVIDDAIADLSVTDGTKNKTKPGASDLFYEGKAEIWIRLANTLKLKMLLQTRLVKSDITDWNGKLSALITANNFIKSGEDFEFWWTGAQASKDERFPTFVSEYGDGQKTCYISPWLYEIMKGMTLNATNNPFAGVQDPRIPYFFYNQETATSKAQGIFEYRDGGFISIFFGTIGGSTAMNSSQAALGVYPVGGKYDDGSGQTVSISSGSGKAPVRIITYYNLQFMLAELALVGDISGDAKAYLKAGIEASMDHVNAVVTEADPDAPLLSSTAVTTFTDAILAKYDAGSTDKKLEIILTQKWIASFLSPIDVYTDYRRTGYPIWFNPLTTSPSNTGYSPMVSDPANPGAPISQVTPFTVVLPVKYQKSLYYNQAEVTRNPNVTQKSDPTAVRIFWDTRTYDY